MTSGMAIVSKSWSNENGEVTRRGNCYGLQERCLEVFHHVTPKKIKDDMNHNTNEYMVAKSNQNDIYVFVAT